MNVMVLLDGMSYTLAFTMKQRCIVQMVRHPAQDPTSGSICTYTLTYTYLYHMKTKLTLSISKARIRRVKAYSARHKKSVSQLVEEFFASLDEGEIQEKPGKKKYMIDEFAGILDGKITKADLKIDPRLAHILRKGS